MAPFSVCVENLWKKVQVFLLTAVHSSCTVFNMRQLFATNLARAMGRMPASHLARALGVGRSAVCAWLKGRAIPSVERTAEIARQLGVSVDALLSEQQP